MTWDEQFRAYAGKPVDSCTYACGQCIGVAAKPLKAGEFLVINDNVHLYSHIETWLNRPAVDFVTEENENAGEDILEEALRLTTGEKIDQYSHPTMDFARTAAMWTALFGREFKKHEVAMAIACVKLSRMTWSPEKRDHWTDLAGYSRTGWICVEHDMENGELE